MLGYEKRIFAENLPLADEYPLMHPRIKAIPRSLNENSKDFCFTLRHPQWDTTANLEHPIACVSIHLERDLWGGAKTP